jgi:hypothetical protein
VNRLGNQLGVASTLGQMGLMSEHLGNLELAESLYRQALEIFENLGAKPQVNGTRQNLQRVLGMRQQR